MCHIRLRITTLLLLLIHTWDHNKMKGLMISRKSALQPQLNPSHLILIGFSLYYFAAGGSSPSIGALLTLLRVMYYTNNDGHLSVSAQSPCLESIKSPPRCLFNHSSAQSLFIWMDIAGNAYMASLRVTLGTAQFWFVAFLTVTILMLPVVAFR